MKRIFFLIALIFILSGCAGSRVATQIGGKIGDSFRVSAERGLSAADSIKSWPYVSGQIRGIYAGNYDLEVPVVMKNIISELDRLAVQETLTEQEKGMVIGYYVRLETLAMEYGWDRYGVSIYKMLIQFIGG